MRTLTHDDIESLAIGAGILGTGGGGNPYVGKVHAQKILREGGVMQLADPSEVDDDHLITSVGYIGAPVVSVERLKRGDEPLVAMRALEKHIGKRFTHVVAGEIGGANSMAPLAIGSMAGLPIVDGDGMGRAFPELQMDTFSILGIPATPAAIADPRDHVAIFDGFAEAETLERYGRSVTIGMGGSAGYAFPVMSGAELRRTVIPGTVTLATELGVAVRMARTHHTDPIAAILGVTGGRALFTGKISDVARRLEGGFSRGTVSFAGMGPDEGSHLDIEFQNENLIATKRGGAILAVVPDLICIVDSDSGEPITTEILRYGLRATVLGIPAPRQIKTEAALKVVGPAAFGYPEVPYIPMEGSFGEGAV